MHKGQYLCRRKITLHRTLILSLILLSIASSNAITIPPSRVHLSNSQKQNVLTQFAFDKGGQGHFTIGKFFGIPVNNQDWAFLRFIVVESQDWSNVMTLSTSTKKNYCELDKIYWGESAIYWNSFDFAQLQETFNVSQPTGSFEIHKAGTYSIVLLNCGTFEVNFILYATFFNIVDGKITHLPLGFIPLPTVYIVFGLGLWPALALPWAYNWYKRCELKIRLHWLYSLYPLLQTVLCLFCAFTFSFISRTGQTPEWLEVFRGCLLFASSCSYFLFRLYASKGYGISRTKLSSQEKRVVVGVAIFVAAAEAAQQIIGGPSVVGVIIFYFISYFYFYWNSRIHLRLLQSYISKLREKSSTEQLVKAYSQKYMLILRTCRIGLCFGFVLLMIQLVDYLALPLALSYIHQILLQLIRGIEFLVMGRLFLLKPIENRITVSSHSLRRREILERQQASQQRQTAPSIILESGTQESGEIATYRNRSPGSTSGISAMFLRTRNWNWLRRG